MIRDRLHLLTASVFLLKSPGAGPGMHVGLLLSGLRHQPPAKISRSPAVPVRDLQGCEHQEAHQWWRYLLPGRPRGPPAHLPPACTSSWLPAYIARILGTCTWVGWLPRQKACAQWTARPRELVLQMQTQEGRVPLILVRIFGLPEQHASNVNTKEDAIYQVVGSTPKPNM